ncbi:hypothetical protein [Burkholderia oklahomensis]|uniref:hypothetical protein n=1 Tax=Burkholderia oklahomensis TaxID=342113 RepID=UPI000AEF1D2B|nr:hypothetical protein [Burkholderia oklahomensis]QPS39330.1 hypothetical protein I6G57_26105 [Burkholderia oklahomensis]
MSDVARAARACVLPERAPDRRCAPPRIVDASAESTSLDPARQRQRRGNRPIGMASPHDDRAARQRSNENHPLPQTLATLFRDPFADGNYGKIGDSIPVPVPNLRRNVRMQRRQQPIRATRSRNAVEKWGGIERDTSLHERLNGPSIISHELIKT